MGICSSCHSGCCYKFEISVTGFDILKIKNQIMLDIDLFLHFKKLITEERIEYQKKYAALFKFTDDNCTHYYFPALKKVRSTLFPEVFKCMFLREWAEENFNAESIESANSKCSVYRARPMACRIYPASFNQDKTKVLVANPYFGKPENIATQLCQRQIENKDFESTKDEVVEALIKRQYELNFFRMLAEDWNSNPKTKKEFIPYLEEAYSQRVFAESDFA